MDCHRLSSLQTLNHTTFGKIISTLLLSMALMYSVMYSAGGRADTVNSVDINNADSETLARVLDGVGDSLSKAIVKERSANGPFLSVDDLQRVNGIGVTVVEKNRTRIILDGDRDDPESKPADTATGESDVASEN